MTRRRNLSIAIVMGAAALAAGAAMADSAPASLPLGRFADPEGVVLAVHTEFDARGGSVRLSVFDTPESFLENAASKHEARIDGEGFAVVPLGKIKPGNYAFVAYLDENGDGRLNRSAIGLPKEPFAFSNGVKPKLRKPKFEEASVEVRPGAVVLLHIDD